MRLSVPMWNILHDAARPGGYRYAAHEWRTVAALERRGLVHHFTRWVDGKRAASCCVATPAGKAAMGPLRSERYPRARMRLIAGGRA